MINSRGKRDTALLKMAKVRKSSQVEEEKNQNQVLVPYLPKDCIFNILVRLPFSSLLTSRMVCKQWYNIIKSQVFIESHLRRSESVLICQTLLKENSDNFQMASTSTEKPHIFSLESCFESSSSVPYLWHRNQQKFLLQYTEFNDCKSKKEEYNVSCHGRVRATCNGLILLTSKLDKDRLIVLNSVTRKLTSLPLGTIFPSNKESYGFVLSNRTGEYKVIHLFYDNLRYVGCEVLTLDKRTWRAVDGPSFGLLKWFGHTPVSAIGALHWLPQIGQSEYIVSMEVDEEKFHIVTLPKTCSKFDGIIELKSLLAFVTHDEFNQIDIWILKGVKGDEWMKHHSITVGCLWDMIPVFSLKISEKVVFWRQEERSFYQYDFLLEEMIQLEMDEDIGFLSSSSFLPHVNSLVSWSSTDAQKFV
ncbi:hypothetical protein L6164_016822 [Bauhinia variegata]|uniref:Uncharacterized protein n=1 Tax=Bauhinia variegata TaxID=167791 RepID=A0ACB9N7V5_BAUVA|nr:hypothetical protein L6164_016822 [Bauhinia variegata]